MGKDCHLHRYSPLCETDAELATPVVSHEVSHAIARHSNERNGATEAFRQMGAVSFLGLLPEECCGAYRHKSSLRLTAGGNFFAPIAVADESTKPTRWPGLLLWL